MFGFNWQMIGLLIVSMLVQGCVTTSSLDVSKADISLMEKVNAVSGKAELAYQSGQYEKSAGLWQQVIDLDPTNVKALYRMGNANFRLGNTELARNFYEKTVEVSPRHSKAHYNLAVINLFLAEQHFKFYSATVDPSADLGNITDMLGEISRFKRGQNKPDLTRLERLAEQLSGKAR